MSPGSIGSEKELQGAWLLFRSRGRNTGYRKIPPACKKTQYCDAREFPFEASLPLEVTKITNAVAVVSGHL